MTLTTDPSDPRLSKYTGPEAPHLQDAVYLVLSAEERAKGFVRPLRRSYRHVGLPVPPYPLRDLTPEEATIFGDHFAKREDTENGRFWLQREVDTIANGCGVVTRMGLALCETYARNPKFYGATYCAGCSDHFPVSEFRWDEDGEVMGS